MSFHLFDSYACALPFQRATDARKTAIGLPRLQGERAHSGTKRCALVTVKNDRGMLPSAQLGRAFQSSFAAC